MAGLFNRANLIDVVTSLIERGVTWYLALGTIVGGGAMTGYAAHVTDWLNAYGPIAWVGSGLLGAVVIAGIWLITGLAREYRGRAHMIKKIMENTDPFNPLDSTFQNKRIRVSDLYDPFRRIQDQKTFIDCEFVGPGVMCFLGSTMEMTTHDCDLAVLKRGQITLNNAVVFNHATVRRCSFYKITLLIPPQDVPSLTAAAHATGTDTLNWITDKIPPGTKPSEPSPAQPGMPPHDH